MVNLPRSVLAFAGAVCLRIKKMVSHLVHIVESTAIDLANALKCPKSWENVDWKTNFLIHLHNALLVTYEEAARYIMEPMRMALAAVIDASFSHFMGQPAFLELIQSTVWKRHGHAISADVVEYRQIRGLAERNRDSMMFPAVSDGL